MRWAALVLLAAGCTSRSEPPPARQRHTPDAYVQPTSLIPDPPDAAPPPPPDATAPLTELAAPCLAHDQGGTVTVDRRTVSYCQGERTCAVWDRKTKRVRIESRFDVEQAADAAIEVETDPKPDTSAMITYREDRIELCPPSRACFQFRPERQEDQSVQTVVLDQDVTSAAVVIAGDGGKDGRVELWSVATGTRRTTVPVRGLDPAITYDITPEFVPTGVIVYAIKTGGPDVDTDDAEALATLYGRDGKKRATLGDGTGNVDYEDVYMLDGRRLAVYDRGAAGEPYAVLVYDVRTGARLSRVEIPLMGDYDATIDRFQEAIIVIEQGDAQQLRIDVIDPRPKKTVHEVFFAPVC